MDIRQAFSSLLGSPHLLAIRPNGPVVSVGNRGLVVDFRSGRPRRYVGKLSDYVATDWAVVTGDQFRAMAEREGHEPGN